MLLTTSAPRLRPMSLFLCFTMLVPFTPLTPAAAVAKSTGTRKASAPMVSAPSTSRLVKRKSDGRAGELLVRFRAGVSDAESEKLVDSKGVRRRGRLRGQSGVERILVGDGQDVEAVAAELCSSAIVEFAERNFTITADQVTPDDPRFPEQWGLRNTGGRGGPAGADINSVSAWAQTTGSPHTVVAVVDGGVDFNHPDLRNNRWVNPKERANNRDDDGDGYADDLHGWDWIDDAKEIRDVRGHGTSVAGVIAAEGNNASGVAGVMWRAGLMSLRVLDSSGKGTVADAVEAIDYAAANGASVINLSWGLDELSFTLRDALARASARGAVVVCSAGNGGRDINGTPYFPASFDLPGVIAVASTNQLDELAAWSNYGSGRVSVAAPGVDLLTTKAGGGYEAVSGSSFSAAMVSGVAGLVKTLRPALSAARARDAILLGARRVAALAGRVSSSGIVDAAAAFEVLRTLPSDGSGGETGARNDVVGKRDNAHASSSEGGTGNVMSIFVPESSVPESNLPNLDSIRGLQPTTPQAPPPIPSTRCSPSNPNCVGGSIAGVHTRLSSPDGEAEGRGRLLADVAGLSLLTPFQAGADGRVARVSMPLTNFLSHSHSTSDVSPSLLSSSAPASLVSGASGVAASAASAALSAGLPSSTPLGYFNDDFNDGVRDASKWDLMNPGGGNILEQNQMLEITPSSSSISMSMPTTTQRGYLRASLIQEDYAHTYLGYTSVPTVDLTDAGASVEILGITGIGSDVGDYGGSRFRLVLDESNWVGFEAAGHTFGNSLSLAARWAIGGEESMSLPVTFDPAQHQHLRIRHNQADDTIVWLTSGDGVDWSVLSVRARPFALNNLRVELSAYSYSPYNAYGSLTFSPTLFDNLLVEPNVANSPPSVSITSPANGATYTEPATININAAAGDTNGTVAKVEFFIDGTWAGEDTAAPFSHAWSNMSPRSYTLTAKATDNQGATATSSPVTVAVNANSPPTVSITSPANGQTFMAPASIVINAAAGDPDSGISKVEFFQGSTKLFEDTAAPYSYTWTGVQAGRQLHPDG